MRRLLLALLLALLLVGCARGDQPGSGPLGTIRGTVLLSPTCPVEQVSSPCPPRPLPGVPVRVVDANGHVQASAVSDDDGRFEIEVGPGSYTLAATIEKDAARSVMPTPVEVVSGEVVRADVLVDSGIR